MAVVGGGSCRDVAVVGVAVVGGGCCRDVAVVGGGSCSGWLL